MKAVAAKAGLPESFAKNDLGARVLGLIRTRDARDGLGLRDRRPFVAHVHSKNLTKCIF